MYTRIQIIGGRGAIASLTLNMLSPRGYVNTFRFTSAVFFRMGGHFARLVCGSEAVVGAKLIVDNINAAPESAVEYAKEVIDFLGACYGRFFGEGITRTTPSNLNN